MKNNLLILCAVLSNVALTAQNAQPSILCGNDIFSKIVREQHPTLHNAFNATFETARTAGGVSDHSPLTVKVVVHIVWKEAAENLHDSIIHNQIEVLNADYNRLNEDTANLRPLFQPVAGNADIQFQLAGIVRVQTNQLFEVNLFGNNLLPEVKYEADGGSDAWDTEKYLNIWVCKIQPLTLGGFPVGQILGFAFPPNNLPNWPSGVGAPTPEEDGVVMDYRVFGSNNPNTLAIPGGTGNLTVKGRSTVHEVGHYFGLRHIWGDGGIFGPNNCDQSDGVDDTPYANAQSAFDCDTTKNTCEQVEMFYNADVPDLVENYMDYASEDCMNMFTKGQVNLMRNVLQGPRSGLLAPMSAQKEVAGQRFDFRLSPNPANEFVTLNFNLLETTDVSIRLLNTDGKSLNFSPQTYPAGGHRVELNVSHLAPGLYFLEMRTERSVRVRKLVVE